MTTAWTSPSVEEQSATDRAAFTSLARVGSLTPLIDGWDLLDLASRGICWIWMSVCLMRSNRVLGSGNHRGP